MAVELEKGPRGGGFMQLPNLDCAHPPWWGEDKGVLQDWAHGSTALKTPSGAHKAGRKNFTFFQAAYKRLHHEGRCN